MIARRALISLLALAACVVVLGAAGAGAATPGETTVIKQSRCYSTGIAPAPEGGVWVRHCGRGDRFSGSTLMLMNADGSITRRHTVPGMHGAIGIGPAGEVWSVAREPVHEVSPAVQRLDPDGSLDEFEFTAKSRPLVIYDVAVGADGAAWATAGEPTYIGPGPASAKGKLLRVAADGTEAEFPLPKNAEPQGVTLGPDGNLWFTAVEGRNSAEHTASPGIGYVGRVTPTGTVTLFPTPTAESNPGAIVAGPDGQLWFYEAAIHRIAKIATDGTFGPEYAIPMRAWHPELTFGPEADLWISGGDVGLLRLTQGGQLSRFGGAPEAVTTDAEGDIWAQSAEMLRRVVPGAPGLQATAFKANRAASTASVRLACGGSPSPCAGTLALSLSYRLRPHRHVLHRIRLARVPYSIGAEAATTLTLPIPAKAFKLARRARDLAPFFMPTLVTVTATVAGGPTLKTSLRANALAAKPRAAGRRPVTTRTAPAAASVSAARIETAAGAPDEVTNFRVRSCSPFAGAFAAAPGEGVLLRTCSGTPTGSTLVNLLPDGRALRRAVPSSQPGPIVAGPAGEIWSVARDEQSPAAQGADLSLDRIAVDGSLATFPLGSAKEPSSRELEAYAAVADGQGGVWVALGELGRAWNGSLFDSTGGELVHVTADGSSTRFPIPQNVEPRALVVGPDGNLWFAGVSGRGLTEHYEYLGSLQIGSLTPAGELTLYPAGGDPGGLGMAVGPDGRIWFTEVGRFDQLLGTVETNGQRQEVYIVHLGAPEGPLVLGPEGAFWMITTRGVVRWTRWRQQTLYPLAEAESVAVGREGEIWALTGKGVSRIVPGGPGIDVWEVTADRKARTARVRLACGGAPTTGCAGTVELALRIPPTQLPKGAKASSIPLGRATYSVPAESTATQTIVLPRRAFALARHYRPRQYGKPRAVVVIARATVAGGPTAYRTIKVPTLAPKG